MDQKLLALLKDVRLAPRGAPRARLDGSALPQDVKDLLAEHDGGSGTVGGQPLVLWSAAQIDEEGEAQEVTRATPGLLLFGTDGGGEGYGYLPRLRQGRYGRISLLAAGPHEFESLGDSLADLLQAVVDRR